MSFQETPDGSRQGKQRLLSIADKVAWCGVAFLPGSIVWIISGRSIHIVSFAGQFGMLANYLIPTLPSTFGILWLVRRHGVKVFRPILQGADRDAVVETSASTPGITLKRSLLFLMLDIVSWISIIYPSGILFYALSHADRCNPGLQVLPSRMWLYSIPMDLPFFIFGMIWLPWRKFTSSRSVFSWHRRAIEIVTPLRILLLVIGIMLVILVALRTAPVCAAIISH